MRMTFSEREVEKALKFELERQEFTILDKDEKEQYSTRFKVYLNKHLPTHTSSFEEFWRKANFDPRDIPPPQPEIDMILVDNRNMWHAIELKAIKKKHRRILPSYYFGLGQTLAYLSFGFDEVAIWQCFDASTLSDEEIFKYNDAFTRIRLPLRRFVGTTYFKITATEKGKLGIQTARSPDNDRSWQNGIGISLPTGKQGIRCVSCNPLLRKVEPQEGIFQFDDNNAQRVNTVRKFLEIQKAKLWDKSN